MARLQIQEDVALAPLTTLGVGGPARFFAHVRSEQDLEQAIDFARSGLLPLVAIGGGSNLLVHDEGFPGLVLHLDLGGEPEIISHGDEVLIRVPAGMNWDRFVQFACERDLSGVECLAGIPGLTGGTPVQNVGAYGQEVAQTIRSVRAFDLHRNVFCSLAHAECRFSYRSSLFNTSARDRYLVTAVTFLLRPGARPALTYGDLVRRFDGQHPSPIEVANAVREIRHAKGMIVTPGDPNSRSAGSFFKNPIVPCSRLEAIAQSQGSSVDAIPHWPMPAALVADSPEVKLPAAWLVEQAGFAKGFRLGRAGISSRHSLALINCGDATFADMAALRDRIRATVDGRFGIRLEQEPIELGPAAVTALPGS